MCLTPFNIIIYCQFLARILGNHLATAISLPRFWGTIWQLPFLCPDFGEPFGNCHFFAQILGNHLATANSLPIFRGTIWQLPIPCPDSGEPFGSCQFLAQILGNLLATAISLPKFWANIWQFFCFCVIVDSSLNESSNYYLVEI